jgi:hypothetical protein
MDQFVLLNIASFLQNNYDALINLSCVCKSFQNLFQPILKNHPIYQNRILANKIGDLNSYLANVAEQIKESPNNVFGLTSLIEYENSVNQICKQLNDLNFISCLLKSPKRTLMTCVKRSITIKGYSSIKLRMSVDDTFQVMYTRTTPMKWMDHLHFSISDVAIKRGIVIEKGVEYDPVNEEVDCYLWHETQKLPKVGTKFLGVSSKTGFVSRYHVTSNGVKIKGDVVCILEQWDKKFVGKHFILKPL